MDKYFLDTNFLLYLIDENSILHLKVKKIFLRFAKVNAHLFLSHQVIEEFIFIVLKLSRLAKESEMNNLRRALEKIGSIPNLTLISLPDEWSSVQKVVDLIGNYKLSPNDSYILQSILFYNVSYLVSFDAKLLRVANRLNIKTV